MAERNGVPCRASTGLKRPDAGLFDSIADVYCARDLLPASRLARRSRLLQTLRAVPFSLETDVLEVGCGGGFAARYLSGRFASYWGVDCSAKLIERARIHNLGPRVRFSVARIEQFSPGRLFDLVLMIGVLHHLDNPNNVLHRLAAFLKPGGWLVANEPQSGNPLVHLARGVRAGIDRSYSRHQRQMSAAELQAAYARAGLVDVKVVPQGLFSTPFAELPLKPQFVLPLAAAACFADRVLERYLKSILYRLTWNLIVAGRRPAEDVNLCTSGPNIP